MRGLRLATVVRELPPRGWRLLEHGVHWAEFQWEPAGLRWDRPAIRVRAYRNEAGVVGLVELTARHRADPNLRFSQAGVRLESRADYALLDGLAHRLGVLSGVNLDAVARGGVL